METLKQPRLFVGLQTYGTSYLVLDLLESCLGNSGHFGSHGSVSCAADKLDGGSGKSMKQARVVCELQEMAKQEIALDFCVTEQRNKYAWIISTRFSPLSAS